jgi:peptidoglycan/LPS O-acetylase OafA/YrhL
MANLLNVQKNNRLEMVRGIAAILVFLNHFIGLHKPLQEKGGAVVGLLGNWGVEAVIIFFVLSGIVINMSQTNNPKGPRVFIVNRFKRVYPLFAIGLILALFVEALISLPLQTLDAILGNICMQGTLQGYVVPVIGGNLPAWSLTFEMAFYLLFALVIASNSLKYLYVWAGLALLSIVLYYRIDHYTGIKGHLIIILAFSAIWLWGYLLYEYSSNFTVNLYTALFSVGLLPIVARLKIIDNYYDIYKFCLFALVSSPFFIYLIGKGGKSRFNIKLIYLFPVYAALSVILFFNSGSLFLNKCLYVSLPVVLLIAGYLFKKVVVTKMPDNLMGKVAEIIGKHSYALYILHYPVLLLCSVLIQNVVLYFLISISSVVIITYLAEKYVQPAVVNVFK